MYVISEDEYLEHHGVMGMRWGVHKVEDPYTIKNPSLTPEQVTERRKKLKKNLLIGTALVASVVVAGLLASNIEDIANQRSYMTEEFYSPNHPIVSNSEIIEKGHIFVRQSSNIETNIPLRSYAFRDPKDTELFPSDHKIEITNKEAIKVASDKEVRDALINIVDKREFIARQKTTKEKIAAATMTKEEIANAELTPIHASWWTNDTSKKLIKELNNLGYSATVDPFTEGSATILFGDDAFIVDTKN